MRKTSAKADKRRLQAQTQNQRIKPPFTHPLLRQPNFGCRKWGCSNWGLPGCLHSLPENRPKSPFSFSDSYFSVVLDWFMVSSCLFRWSFTCPTLAVNARNRAKTTNFQKEVTFLGTPVILMPDFCLFCPFPGGPTSTWNTRNEGKKLFFSQISSVLFKPHLLNVLLRHSKLFLTSRIPTTVRGNPTKRLLNRGGEQKNRCLESRDSTHGSLVILNR